MNMFVERTWVVTIEVDGVVGQAQLYAKFNELGRVNEIALFPEPILVAPLRSRKVLTGRAACDDILAYELTAMVLGPLGSTNSFAFHHSMFVKRPGAEWKCSEVREKYSIGEVLPGQRWLNTDPNVEISIDGVIVSTNAGFELHNLITKSDILIQCCGTCAHGRTPRYGGEDDRFALFCFRDTPNPERYRYLHTPDYAAAAWSSVDAYHCCPRYELDHYFVSEKWKDLGKVHEVIPLEAIDREGPLWPSQYRYEEMDLAVGDRVRLKWCSQYPCAIMLLNKEQFARYEQGVPYQWTSKHYATEPNKYQGVGPDKPTKSSKTFVIVIEAYDLAKSLEYELAVERKEKT